MITAEIMLSRIVGFIVAKSLSALGKLSPNDRKKACRSLTKLYYCLQALEDVTESILDCAKDYRTTKTGVAFTVVNALNNHRQDVELASNMFIDLSHELRGGLQIIDPALATCCDALYASKFDFLREMSESITWDRTISETKMIIKMPKRTTTEAILNEKYKEAILALREGETYYWPDIWIESDDPHPTVLTWEDNDTAEKFMENLTQHRDKLSDAKQKLRELLRTRFNIEELLFQSDSHPYR
ncbi:hypothetical protein [Pseudomonas sp. NMI760_13]|uniref:hypothetical protein n=1 Tax=Pseudomonas sp. NMI760_13 TaxID=2903147 RepID=UPI001E622ED9|nr:hypothetical protein [Pseudomonas sp. NMI760_13]MCE0915620.1 hypothetical protein [Pseudomonas sp. NMI760_13]